MSVTKILVCVRLLRLHLLNDLRHFVEFYTCSSVDRYLASLGRPSEFLLLLSSFEVNILHLS